MHLLNKFSSEDIHCNVMILILRKSWFSFIIVGVVFLILLLLNKSYFISALKLGKMRKVILIQYKQRITYLIWLASFYAEYLNFLNR